MTDAHVCFFLEPFHSLGRPMLARFLDRDGGQVMDSLPCLRSLCLPISKGHGEGRMTGKDNWEGQRRPQPVGLMGFGLACLGERRAGTGREFTVNCQWAKGCEGQTALGNPIDDSPKFCGPAPCLLHAGEALAEVVPLGCLLSSGQHGGVCHWV